MFSGAHMVIFSNDAEADRALFHTLFPDNSVDAGHGWLIFKLPPAEIAVHPPHGNLRHELHLICDDIHGVQRTAPCAPQPLQNGSANFCGALRRETRKPDID